jgi:GTP diphosphokinase / guanosine-3',5'-bis(diphosphate) 3'-diphosphatase
MSASIYALVDQRVADLRTKVKAYLPNADLEVLHRGYEYARMKHVGQTRKNGEPYIGHPVEVAHFASDLGLDMDSLLAALLHDVVEDTETSEDEIRHEFGDSVAFLVGSLTKISKLQFESKEHAQAENVRKLVVTMSQDIRVVLIKLADRLHNMLTLEHMSQSGQQRIARETLDIYAPIAHRLGIHWVKSQLEDAAFRFLQPEEYRSLASQIQVKRVEREAYVERVLKQVRVIMQESGVKCEVQGRPKHLYSIHQKITKSRTEFENIYDLTAFRVIVDSKNECYEAVGIVHALWRPVPGRFKDYIAEPKPNGYRSLHTVVLGPEGQRIEFQIRTEDMHRVAEYGVAAHIGYKEGRASTSIDSKQLQWLRELSATASSTADSRAFLDIAKTDLFTDEIYIVTPKGTVVALPKGSTPVDFAYAIHSEVGDRCKIAMVNGKVASLRHELKNGDTVNIITAKDQKPRQEWLEFAISTRAKAKIKQAIANERREKDLLAGRAMLSAELLKAGLRIDAVAKRGDLAAVAELMKYQNAENLIVAVGSYRVKPSTIVQRILPPETAAKSTPMVEQAKRFGEKLVDALMFRKASKDIIRVSGLDGETETTYARCCDPVPGDPIVGYVSRRGSIHIHNENCTRRHLLDEMRMVDVAWAPQSSTPNDKTPRRNVMIRVICHDGTGMLAEMTQALASKGVNIRNAMCRSGADRRGHNLFEVEVTDSRQLEEALKMLRNVTGVISAERVRG